MNFESKKDDKIKKYINIIEQNSEIEDDVLSSEISYEKMYQKLLNPMKQNPIILIQSDKTIFIKQEDIIKKLNEVENSTNELINLVYNNFYSCYIQVMFNDELDINEFLLLLDSNCNTLKHYGVTYSPYISQYIQYAAQRLQAFIYYKTNNYLLAIKCLTPIIIASPSINGIYMNDLSDTLVLLTECYSALGKIYIYIYITIIHIYIIITIILLLQYYINCFSY